tara:strand:+ start:485 stop:805 length:321 start_codon:yes stop_codon:yes gene_type:complete
VSDVQLADRCPFHERGHIGVRCFPDLSGVQMVSRDEHAKYCRLGSDPSACPRRCCLSDLAQTGEGVEFVEARPIWDCDQTVDELEEGRGLGPGKARSLYAERIRRP